MTKKNFLLTIFLVFLSCIVNAQSRYIKGKLDFMDAPLANAEVEIEHSETRVKTKKDGSYSIVADIGDVLIYSYPGLETVEIIVEDITSILNIVMNQKITELNEVVVKGSNRKSQKELEEEYWYNKNLIKTAWGILDKETAPGMMRFLEKKDINEVGVCILGLLRNEFAGVSISGNCTEGGSVSIRGRSSVSFKVNAIFDVDGQIFTDPPIWILPASIERIAVLSSRSLTNRYGSIGAGGVVVVNTIAKYDMSTGGMLDRARLKNNIYLKNAIGQFDFNKSLPTYLQELENSIGTNAAQKVFNAHKKSYAASAFYFIDAYNFFAKNGDQNFANQIRKEHLSFFEDNPVYMKALAYYLESNGDSKQANELNEQIFIMRPSYSQSYRDLAESYRNVANYKKSAAMYARYNYLVDEEFLKKDSTGIFSIIERESENLMALDGDKVLIGAKRINRSTKFTEFDGTRLLFEWNDSEAEFELQFVNPENHYFTWKHTSEDNAARIKDEKLKGYSCEEFLVDGSLPGKWKINVNYKGNKKLEPSYLKVTTYYNYGTVSQHKTVKVYRLGLKNVNQQLFDLNNSGMVLAN